MKIRILKLWRTRLNCDTVAVRGGSHLEVTAIQIVPAIRNGALVRLNPRILQ